MVYLFNKWDRLKDELRDKYIFLFLDYDGTLTPIAATPDKAIMPVASKTLLARLSKTPGCQIAIISGRSLKDIKKSIGLKNITYVGNHGLEFEGPKIRFTSHASLKYRKIIGKIKDILNRKLCSIKGILLEDKNLSLSLHYRLVKKQDLSVLKAAFYETIAAFRLGEQVRIRTGKKVFEIMPPVNLDKGKIVLWLLARQAFALKNEEILPIYIGDDTTDEDAFKALKNKGIAVFVGRPKRSYADYYLKNSKEVLRFLQRVQKIKQQ